MDTGKLIKFGKKWSNYGSNWAKAYALAGVIKAEKEMVKRAKEALDKYYSKYTPIYYHPSDSEDKYGTFRTMNMYNDVYTPYHTKTISKAYNYTLKGGIKLSSSKLNYKKRGISIQSIYYQSIHLGQHGVEHLKYGEVDKWRPILTTPIPYDYMDKYRTSATLWNAIRKAGLNAASKVPKPQ